MFRKSFYLWSVLTLAILTACASLTGVEELPTHTPTVTASIAASVTSTPSP